MPQLPVNISEHL